MPVELQSAWIQVIGTGLFALFAGVFGWFLSRYFGRRDKGRSKVIQTSSSIASIVNPKRIGPLSVSVDKEFLTSQPSDKGTTVPVSSAYSFSTRVSNIGIEDLENPEIDITLADGATIVQASADSDHISRDKINIQRDASQLNYVRITPQYINKGKEIVVSILSVGNQNNEYKVRVSGFGVIHEERSAYELSKRSTRSWFSISSIATNIAVPLTLLIALLGLFSTFSDATSLSIISRRERDEALQATITAREEQNTSLLATLVAIQSIQPTSTVTATNSLQP